MYLWKILIPFPLYPGWSLPSPLHGVMKYQQSFGPNNRPPVLKHQISCAPRHIFTTRRILLLRHMYNNMWENDKYNNFPRLTWPRGTATIGVFHASRPAVNLRSNNNNSSPAQTKRRDGGGDILPYSRRQTTQILYIDINPAVLRGWTVNPIKLCNALGGERSKRRELIYYIIRGDKTTYIIPIILQ